MDACADGGWPDAVLYQRYAAAAASSCGDAAGGEPPKELYRVMCRQDTGGFSPGDIGDAEGGDFPGGGRGDRACGPVRAGGWTGGGIGPGDERRAAPGDRICTRRPAEADAVGLALFGL